MAKRIYYDAERRMEVSVVGETGDESIKIRLRTVQGDEYEVSLTEFLSMQFVERTGSFE